MKLSNGQILVIAAGGGFLLWAISRQQQGLPIFGGLGFSTIQPNAPTYQQQAAYWAQRAGMQPSAPGSSGSGATSQLPVYAGALAGLGSFVGGLFNKIAGPGNAAPASRPQASASSGGGVSQPSSAYTPLFDQSSIYFGDYDNSFADFPDMAAGINVVSQEVITSDQGTYDVLSGEWY